MAQDALFSIAISFGSQCRVLMSFSTIWLMACDSSANEMGMTESDGIDVGSQQELRSSASEPKSNDFSSQIP
jgi:hypothetical protein